MKIKIASLGILVLATFVSFAQSTRFIAYNLTRSITHHLETRRYDSICRLMSPSLAQAMDAVRLQNEWNALVGDLGSFKNFGNTHIDTLNRTHHSETPIIFSKARAVLSLTFNEAHEAVAFNLLKQYEHVVPDYVNDLLFDEYRVSFGKPPYVVDALLTVPVGASPAPCALLIGDRGNQDKDMSYGDNKAYKDLALGLACSGIAVLRYDKRNSSYGPLLMSNKFAGIPFTLKEEYIEDASYALEFLKQEKRIDNTRIFIIGHGQGGSMAPFVAPEGKGVAGIALLATPARSLQQTMISELEYMDTNAHVTAGMRDNMRSMRRKLLASQNSRLKPDVPEDSLPGGTALYWISANKLKHAEAMSKLKLPMLVVNCERDYQTTSVDFELWKKLLAKNPRCRFLSYPKLNHYMMEGEGPSSLYEYPIRNNVPAYLMKDIASWIQQTANE